MSTTIVILGWLNDVQSHNGEGHRVTGDTEPTNLNHPSPNQGHEPDRVGCGGAMTVHAVLVDPPRPGLVLGDIAATAPVSDDDAADLYAAMLKDTFRSVASSGGDLLVNYRADDDIPAAYQTDSTVKEELEGLVRQALDEPEPTRYEVQVGSTFDARVGNTVTHLLREEGVDSVAVLEGQSPTVVRTDLDNAAMKLRRSEFVLGPAPGGHVYYAGLTEPIDFSGAFEPPEARTLVDRAAATGSHVDFLPMHPRVETAQDLVTLVSIVGARRAAGRTVPAFTADVLDRLQLSVVASNGERTLVRETDTS